MLAALENPFVFNVCDSLRDGEFIGKIEIEAEGQERSAGYA
jgi:hypothetical protein